MLRQHDNQPRSTIEPERRPQLPQHATGVSMSSVKHVLIASAMLGGTTIYPPFLTGNVRHSTPYMVFVRLC